MNRLAVSGLIGHRSRVWNYVILIVNDAVFRVGISLMSPITILPLFVSLLSDSQRTSVRLSRRLRQCAPSSDDRVRLRAITRSHP